MKVDVKQVWEYELLPSDTMRTLHAFKNAWELYGDRIELTRKGDKLYAIRVQDARDGSNARGRKANQR